jgi:predicted MFS family arabinose efflux permease
MQAQASAFPHPSVERTAAWGAVFAMSLCVFVLIASEFMPVSLLTPIATDLAMTEGQAGQAISVSGIFAVITSLLISQVTSRMDRKRVLLSLTGLMALSGVIVAFSPSYASDDDRTRTARHVDWRLLVHVNVHRDAACT